MSATDELRRLLDERGVEHYDGIGKTYWLNDKRAYRASADEVSNGLIQLHLWCTTPEQAVEATLGRTCVVEEASFDEMDELPHTWLSCGHITLLLPDEMRYCPQCGARILVPNSNLLGHEEER